MGHDSRANGFAFTHHGTEEEIRRTRKRRGEDDAHSKTDAHDDGSNACHFHFLVYAI